LTKGARSRVYGVRASDLRGVAQLATRGTSGVIRIAEEVTHSVWRSLGLAGKGPAGKTRGITGLVFDAIQCINHWAGKSADLLFEKMLPLLRTVEATPIDAYPREAVLAALNGVLGDRLLESSNPLATPMGLRYRGQTLGDALPGTSGPLDMPGATGKVLLMVHGLCMNDLQWETQQPDGSTHNHGTALSEALGYTPVFVRYNTGLHTSVNGRELSRHLQFMAARWPVPLEEISVVAHSMGGLVARSALHVAQSEHLQKTAPDGPGNWYGLVKKVVFLGTPHHGAPLEKAGNWLDVLLGSTPYTRPFAKLGQLRSAGITDLRYGHVVDADWLDHDRFRRRPDSRVHVPLPRGIGFYTVAASIAAARSAVSERTLGDGLVPLPSALGRHVQAGRSLQFAKGSQWIAYRHSHMALLSSAAVTRKLCSWLAEEPASTNNASA